MVYFKIILLVLYLQLGVLGVVANGGAWWVYVIAFTLLGLLILFTKNREESWVRTFIISGSTLCGLSIVMALS